VEERLRERVHVACRALVRHACLARRFFL
jgi:hypothetical protein